MDGIGCIFVTMSTQSVNYKMIFSDYYVAYLRHQAINHPALQHDDASGSRVFNMLNLEETFGDLRTGSKEKDFIMRGIWPTQQISDRYTEGEVRKYWEGGFIVAKYHKDTTLPAIQNAIAGSEQIADEIIEKMIADSLNGHPLFYHSLDSNQNIQLSTFALMAPNWSGVRVLFDFWNFWRNCVDHDTAPGWLDGGLTPLPNAPAIELIDDLNDTLIDDLNDTLTVDR